MDDLDRQIISLLQKDGRRAFTEIAQILAVAEGTVRKRVGRLMNEGALQIVGLVDPHRLGLDAPALIGISVQPPNLEAAVNQIVTFPEVSYLIMVSGEYDLMVEVMCRDRKHLASFLNHSLRQVAGIQKTETFFILHTFKMAHGSRPRLLPRVANPGPDPDSSGSSK